MSFQPQDPARRKLFGGAAALAVVSAFQALHVRHAQARPVTPGAGPYGPLAPVNDLTTGLPLLQLPPDFRYHSFAWAGDRMTNGAPCPGGHDGMAVVESRQGPRGPELVLIRNHELGLGNALPASAVYDAATVDGGRVAGGTTTLIYRMNGFDSIAPSLGGTARNCAGGPTPWGTWLSCEETLEDYRAQGGEKHGYVFEVRPAAGETTAEPIVGMGRMAHEAVAIDPLTSHAYLTEDARNMAGLYRYVPDDTSGAPGSLERGGRLQAARVVGADRADLSVARVGDSHRLEWVDLDDPDADPVPYADELVSGTASGPFAQARAKGCLRMARGEGIWHHAGQIFIVDTATGVDGQGRRGRGNGAVWVLDLASDTLTAIFVSQNPVAANNPDNVTVSPRGGLVLCEDGGGVQDAYGFGERLLGLDAEGDPYILCKNNVVLSAADVAAAGKTARPGDYREREFCGACFDPRGRVLFVNIQTPGITFAIQGPWARGNL